MSDSNYKILIVDDDSDALKVVGSVLLEKNIDISLAQNGQTALKRVEEIKPDIILLDISMPDISGFEVCKRLKKNEKTKDIPIIFLTARDQTNEVVEGFKLGAVDYITKPYEKDILKARIDTHLEIKHSRDIIETQRQNLLNKNKELQELIATRDRLFSIISHDIKGPIHYIIGYSGLLIDSVSKSGDPEAEVHARYISESIDELNSVLENLLEWSNLQQNKTIFSPERINLKQLVDSALRLYKKIALQKSVTIENEIDDNIFVVVDKYMIATVLRNLLINALKYSYKNGLITIKAKPNENGVVLSVIDRGVGISKEKIPILFSIQKKKTTKGTDDEKGSGLGLILCKEYIEKHNSHIHIESTPGKGTTVSFFMPAEKH